jgi:pimeloyl-ACP methyl ester carboxylesterase
LPQFTLPIDVEDHGEMTIHFVHQPSTRENAIPLIFCHGWPGSFHEVSKILPMLTSPPDDKQAFHVVAPRSPAFSLVLTLVSPGIVGAQIPVNEDSILAK